MLLLISTNIQAMVLDLMEKQLFAFPNGSFGQNVIIFGADMSSSIHVDNKKNYILILGEGITQGLDDTTLTAEQMNSINFTASRKKFCLSLHYNGANSYYLLMVQKLLNLKQKILKLSINYA